MDSGTEHTVWNDESAVEWHFRPVAVFRGGAVRRYDAPRQGVFDGGAEGVVEFAPGRNFETALRDLAGFERAWLLFVFDRNAGAWRPTARPPVAPAEGPERIGVFATRSPYRPNPIGLSCVRILGVEKLRVHIAEADLLDGTPILDLKPYVPAADSFPNARASWVERQAAERWTVAESAEFRAQADAIRAWQGPDLAATARLQLAADPFDATRKRVVRTPEGGTLSLRMFRIDFAADPAARTLTLLRIRSGYAPDDLRAVADPYGDKGLHRRLVDFPTQGQKSAPPARVPPRGRDTAAR